MILLTFITGAGIRKVNIDDKKIIFLASELSFKPLEIDLNKLDSEQMQNTIKKAKMSGEEVKNLKELSKLSNEEEIAKDIIKDFKKTGWRLVKKDGSR